MYTSLIRPLLFRLDPETMHAATVRALQLYRHLPPARSLVRRLYTPSPAPFRWKNLVFPNRIGLSAGFDKNAASFDELADFGFGFLETGTVTPLAIKGNPRPRIFRLPRHEALISRTGFNNPGQEEVAQNLRRKRPGRYILGVNINTHHPEDAALAVNELSALFTRFAPEADYYTLNWGSMTSDTLASALAAFHPLPAKATHPVFLKLPADIPLDQLDGVLRFTVDNGADGLIATGPTQDRSALTGYPAEELARIGAGGVSGRPVFEKSLERVNYLAAHAPEDLLIIGAGGVMTETEVIRMVEAGADLIQIYTSFIYNGPAIVRRMAERMSQGLTAQ